MSQTCHHILRKEGDAAQVLVWGFFFLMSVSREAACAECGLIEIQDKTLMDSAEL